MSRLQPLPFTQLTYFFIMLGNSYHKAKYLTYPSRIEFFLTSNKQKNIVKCMTLYFAKHSKHNKMNNLYFIPCSDRARPATSRRSSDTVSIAWVKPSTEWTPRHDVPWHVHWIVFIKTDWWQIKAFVSGNVSRFAPTPPPDPPPQTTTTTKACALSALDGDISRKIKASLGNLFHLKNAFRKSSIH